MMHTMTIIFDGLRFGLELECGGVPRARVARAVQQVVGGYLHEATTVIAADGRWWRVVADASLKNWPPELRCEVVSPILQYDDLPLLQAVVRAVRKAGAMVDERCAIHIHVDAALFTGKQLCTLAKLVYQQEELLYAALGISEERAERYAKPTDPAFIRLLEQRRPATLGAMNRLWYGQHEAQPTHYHPTRYRGVNFHAIWDKGTVEFRWFESTLHAGKVKAYVQFILALVTKARTARAATSRRRTFDAACARYDWRVFLLRLGLIGDEFKTARKFLLALMSGDSAFKHGRSSVKPGISAE